MGYMAIDMHVCMYVCMYVQGGHGIYGYRHACVYVCVRRTWDIWL